ncbi:MAG TPA: hypothetical protein VMB71_15265 [Acetobacteraceae bacterium]|nr:hypothetical protein [Acetobacteraceae bacterium]
MTMMISAAGRCTNDRVCFVAGGNEIVRPRNGFAFACWHCGQPLTAVSVPMRSRRMLGGSGVAVAGSFLLVLGIAFGGIMVAKSALAHQVAAPALHLSGTARSA